MRGTGTGTGMGMGMGMGMGTGTRDPRLPALDPLGAPPIASAA